MATVLGVGDKELGVVHNCYIGTKRNDGGVERIGKESMEEVLTGEDNERLLLIMNKNCSLFYVCCVTFLLVVHLFIRLHDSCRK